MADQTVPDNRFRITSPEGSEISIPAAVDEATDPYPGIGDRAAIREY